MEKKNILLSMVAASALMFTGCGSGSSVINSSTTKIGTLIDAEVDGVNYTCGSLSGTTQNGGQFKYNTSCEVQFKIGDLIIGKINGSKISSDSQVWPQDLASDNADGNRTTVTYQAEMIARVLQSLDNDANPANGIDITGNTDAFDMNTTKSLSNMNASDVNSTLETNRGDLDLTSGINALIHLTGTMTSELNISRSATVPQLGDFTLNDFNETLAANEVVGNIYAVSNADAIDNFHIISGNDNNLFYIEAVNGEGIVKLNKNGFNNTNHDNHGLNYDTQSSHSLVVRAENGEGNSTDKTIVITYEDIDYVPTISLGSGDDANLTVHENSDINTESGNLNLDDGGTTILDVNITENNGTVSEYFSVDSSGSIKVKATLPNYNDRMEHNLTINAQNAEGNSSLNILIPINEIYVVPSIESFTGAIDENAVAATVVGNIGLNAGGKDISAVDLNTSSSPFEITTFSNTSATVSLKTGETLDYETMSEYNLSVTATNSEGTSSIYPLNITIGDITTGEAVTDLMATYGTTDNNITLSWTLNGSNDQAKYFHVYRNTQGAAGLGGKIPVTINNTDTSYTDTTAYSATAYKYTLMSIGDDQNGTADINGSLSNTYSTMGYKVAFDTNYTTNIDNVIDLAITVYDFGGDKYHDVYITRDNNYTMLSHIAEGNLYDVNSSSPSYNIAGTQGQYENVDHNDSSLTPIASSAFSGNNYFITEDGLYYNNAWGGTESDVSKVELNSAISNATDLSEIIDGSGKYYISHDVNKISQVMVNNGADSTEGNVTQITEITGQTVKAITTSDDVVYALTENNTIHSANLNATGSVNTLSLINTPINTLEDIINVKGVIFVMDNTGKVYILKVSDDNGIFLETDIPLMEKIAIERKADGTNTKLIGITKNGTLIKITRNN